MLYPAPDGFPLRPAALTRCRIDIAIKIRVEWHWRIWMPFSPTRWRVCHRRHLCLPLERFEFALLRRGKGMRRRATTEGWLRCHGTRTREETGMGMEREGAKAMDG
jgi:hypothetical protein